MEYVTASDVKRYAYCPKIIYFTHVLHLKERVTEAMEYGRELHKDEFILPIIAKVKPAKILRGIELVSDKLRVSGKPDFILVTRFNEYIPVEVKWAEESSKGSAKKDHKYQLATYALLVEERYSTTVKRGYIYYVRCRSVVEVPLTSRLKGEVKRVLREIYKIIEEEREPAVNVGRGRCANCGWRRYCKGVARTSMS